MYILYNSKLIYYIEKSNIIFLNYISSKYSKAINYLVGS